MKHEVTITDSSFGLTRGKSDIETKDGSMQVSAITMASKPMLRAIIAVLQAALVVALFGAVEIFVVFPNFGDIISKWTDWSYFQQPALAVINLVKIGFGVAFFFLFPLAGSVWVSGKAVQPLRRRFSIPIQIAVPFGEVRLLELTGEGELKIAFAQQPSNQHITLKSPELDKLCLRLLFYCVPDIQGLAQRTGGAIESETATQRVLSIRMVACSHEYKVTEQAIETQTSDQIPPRIDALVRGLILRYLFTLAYHTPPSPASDAEPDIDFVSLDKDKYKSFMDSLSEIIGTKTALFSSCASKLGAADIQSSSEKASYKLNLMPHLSVWLRYAPNWVGNYKASFHLRSADVAFWGKDVMVGICETLAFAMRSLAEEQKKEKAK